MVDGGGFSTKLLDIYSEFNVTLANAGLNYITEFVNITLLILLAFLYALFVWKIYEIMSTKNFLGKYFDNLARSNNSMSVKLTYFLEYIIISPFIIFFWFIAFAIFILLLTNIQEITTILIIVTIIIATIRMTAYINKELSKEIAKILPFTLLAIAITTPDFFNMERIFERVGEISSIFSSMWFYLLLIFLLEVILRFFGFIFALFGLEEIGEE